MLYLVLSYLPAILCGIHVVRTRQPLYWLFILVIAGPLGVAIYFFAIILPDLMSGPTANRFGRAARKVIDPQREYRIAATAMDESPTVANRMRIAAAAAQIGRWDEAEEHWRDCVHGQWAEDPVIVMGHARALIELGRFAEALDRLEGLAKIGDGADAQTPAAALLFARTYEGLGRTEEAEEPYRFAADRVPGLEAGSRYVAFLARTGRREDARIGLEEIERRLSKIHGALKGEARVWRDLAARAVGGG